MAHLGDDEPTKPENRSDALAINGVDVVIDGGYGGNEPSTIVDCTSSAHEVIRQGKGILEE